MNEHLRGGLLLAVYAALTLAAPPALDFLQKHHLRSEGAQAKARANFGAVPTAIGVAVTTVNREVRIPAADALLPIQRVFRIEQSWNFYSGSLDQLHRLEVWIDDGLVYRSGDPEYGWLADELTSRRLRPIVQATVVTEGSRNARGLARFVVKRAREEFPDAREVTLAATRGDFPGLTMETAHSLTARGPDWVVEPSK